MREEAAGRDGGGIEEGFGDKWGCVELVPGLVRVADDEDFGFGWEWGGGEGVAEADWKWPVTMRANLAALRR